MSFISVLSLWSDSEVIEVTAHLNVAILLSPRVISLDAEVLDAWALYPIIVELLPVRKRFPALAPRAVF